MRTLTTKLSLATVLLSVMAPFLWAQARVVADPDGDIGVIDFGFQAPIQRPQNAERQRRARLKQYLAFRIDEMKRFCDLSQPQVKKLEVAAKGAIEQFIGKWQAQMQQQAQVNGFVFVNPAVDGEAQILVQADELIIDEEVDGDVGEENGDEGGEALEGGQQVLQEEPRLLEEPEPEPEAFAFPVPAQPAVPMIQLNPPIAQPAPALQWQAAVQPTADVSSVVNEPVWQQTVQRVLTDEQQQTLRAVRDRRQAFRSKALVVGIVAELDERLSFSAEQRTQIVAFLQKCFDEKQINLPHGIGSDHASRVVALHFFEEFGGFLSEAQLQQLQGFGQNGQRQPQVMFNNNGRFIIQGIPAEPPVEIPPPQIPPANAPPATVE